MTMESEKLNVQKRFAVVFDMCSSSSLIEELIRTHNLGPMRNLIISVKRLLMRESQSLRFEVHKFIGDGWILLFDVGTSGEELIRFLERLSAHFKSEFERWVAPVLKRTPTVTGLTFGIDRGPLVPMVMQQRIEYIGRPLNVAARLQTAIKDRDQRPQYKVLLSKNAYSALRVPNGFRRTVIVRRSLRNINEGKECQFVKVVLRVAGGAEGTS